MPPDDAPVPAAPTPPKLPPRWVRPVLLVAAWAMLLAAVADVTGFAFPDHPANVFHGAGLPALFYVLVPVLLLYALFGARRGIERGYAAETGMLPGLLLFGVLMFIVGAVTESVPHTQGLGLLLLAAFAAARVDPPAPPGIRLVWAGLAGVFGAWCVHRDLGGLGGVGALALYAGWSARRGAENGLPVAPARRLIGMLLFVALMGVPAAVVREDMGFVTVPLSVAAGLILLDVCSPALDCRAGAPPAA